MKVLNDFTREMWIGFAGAQPFPSGRQPQFADFDHSLICVCDGQIEVFLPDLDEDLNGWMLDCAGWSEDAILFVAEGVARVLRDTDKQGGLEAVKKLMGSFAFRPTN